MTAIERLEARIQELNVSAKKSLGQNFLIADHIINKIIKAVQEHSPQVLIEVGPGCGALTDLLLPLGAKLTLIELDKTFAAYWLSKGLNVIEADALDMNWEFDKESVLVSNLPYQISSSLVIERSMDSEQLNAMVLMFQKEVAQRIRAVPSSEHFGMLSVVAQEFWNIETVCDAGPRDFKPPPKVSSRVLSFIPKKSNITNKPEYLGFVKTCFRQRRRILSNNLQLLPMAQYEPEKLAEWLLAHKKQSKIRAEELSVTEINSLYHFLRKT